MRRCVVSAFLVFFSRIKVCFFSQEHFCTSQKNTLTKKRESSSFGGAFNKRQRRDFETTRFSFSFLLRTTRREKKIHSRQKESFHLLLQKRARALKEHRHTHAHTKPRERERKKDDAFFFFSDRVVCLFCVRIICEDHREREREKTFYHLASDKREEKTLTSSCF